MNVPHVSPGKFQGCRRGVFGLKSWEPLPKPSAGAFNPLPELRVIRGTSESGSAASSSPPVSLGNGVQFGGIAGYTQSAYSSGVNQNASSAVRTLQNPAGMIDASANPYTAGSGGGFGGGTHFLGGNTVTNHAVVVAEKPFEGATRPAEVSRAVPQAVVAAVHANLASNAMVANPAAAFAEPDWLDEPEEVMMKYSYKANPDSPLGMELSATQREMVMRLGEQAGETKLWTYVQNTRGERGYVPISYVTVLVKQVTSLPWLQGSTPPDTLPVTTEPYKPYKSAYVKETAPPAAGTGGTAASAPNWYCEVCAKSFNGPQPYNAHMLSRAHKDELAAQS